MVLKYLKYPAESTVRRDLRMNLLCVSGDSKPDAKPRPGVPPWAGARARASRRMRGEPRATGNGRDSKGGRGSSDLSGAHSVASCTVTCTGNASPQAGEPQCQLVASRSVSSHVIMMELPPAALSGAAECNSPAPGPQSQSSEYYIVQAPGRGR